MEVSTGWHYKEVNKYRDVFKTPTNIELFAEIINGYQSLFLQKAPS